MTALKFSLAALVAAATLTGAALAHVSMKASNIAADAVIDTLPAAFTMSFTQAVGLASFSLENDQGAPVTFDYTPPKGMAIEYSVPLPRLAPGRYLAKWRTISKDGHAMAGEIGFTLSPKPRE
jgi:copper resistance protein C